MHSLVWDCLITWNQHFNVGQSLFLTEMLPCCFTNHYGPMHWALSTGKTWKGTAKGLWQGRGKSISTFPVTSSELSPRVPTTLNPLRCSALPVSMGANNNPVPMVALWASGWTLLAPSSLHRGGRHAHCWGDLHVCPARQLHPLKNSVTVSFTNCLWVISWGNFKIFS